MSYKTSGRAAAKTLKTLRPRHPKLETGRIEAVKKYLIVIEKTSNGYSAYSPDVPGCGSTGSTREEAESNIREAIQFHIDGLKQEGFEIPEPSSYSSYVNVAA